MYVFLVRNNVLPTLPPVFDDGDLEQGGDVEDPYEEGDCHPVQLREQEDEGGGEGARHGEQEKLHTHYNHSWSGVGQKIDIYFYGCKCIYTILDFSFNLS